MSTLDGTVVHVRDVASRDDHVEGEMFLRPLNVYVGRFQPWGAGRYFKASDWENPYPVKQYGLMESLRLCEADLRDDYELMAKLPELGGKVLACWCAGKDGVPEILGREEPTYCHGQILLRLIAEKTWAKG